MASKWTDGLPRWPSHRGNDGAEYSLAHLHPQRFTLSFAALRGYPARDVEIRVGYSSHAFTIRCPNGVQAHHPYSKPNEPRVFCPVRYGLSLELPAIITSLETRKCYATSRKNYFIVEQVAGLLPALEYWVFFDVRKCADPDAAKVLVESAYAGNREQAPHNRSRKGDSFRALVSAALELTKRPL